MLKIYSFLEMLSSLVAKFESLTSLQLFHIFLFVFYCCR